MGKEMCSGDVNWIVRGKGMVITSLKMWVSQITMNILRN